MNRVFNFHTKEVTRSYLPVLERPKSNDKALKLIFAPNPVTGWPSSSLAVYMNPRTAPEVKQWIENNLGSIDRSAPSGTDDDTAMACIKERNLQYGEELNVYRKQLGEFIKSRMSSHDDDE